MTDGDGAPSRSRRKPARTGSARSVWRYATVVALTFLAAMGMSAPAAIAAGAEDLIKVFVVPGSGRTADGPATLTGIAASTLGDSARAGEIFDLNQGLAQPDGGALSRPDEQLRPGWILRLPQDASGVGVRLARDTGATGQSDNGAGDPIPAVGGALRVPLAAAVAVLGTVVLALVTAGIVARRRLRAAFTASMVAVRRLGDPLARRRRLAFRRAMGRRFAADGTSVHAAYAAVADLSGSGSARGRAVYALHVDGTGVTVWLPPRHVPGAPWTALDGPDGVRWRRLGTGRGTDASAAADPEACLVRVGAAADGEPVIVDLSRVDGVLCVTGDQRVARDIVDHLQAEVLRARTATRVMALGGVGVSPFPAVPSGSDRTVRAEPGTAAPGVRPHRTVRGAAARRPVQALVVARDMPGERQKAELAALCGPGGAGWTGLVCGEVAEAHWRWHAHSDGSVDIPVLGLRLTVPA